MGDPLDLTLARIRTKLRGRTLGARLSSAAVEAFETEHGVRLPDEYRRFLLQAGNGGAGPPLYGLMHLGEVPHDFGRNAQEQLARLVRPFPLSRYWVWEADEPLNDEEEALRAGGRRNPRAGARRVRHVLASRHHGSRARPSVADH